MAMRHRGIHYYSHRGRRAHPSTLVHRISSGIVLPFALVILAGIGATGAATVSWAHQAEASTVIQALLFSLARLGIAFVLALVVGIALGLLAERGKHLEAALLPVFDVLESMPVLAFFPMVILFFINAGLLEGAAIFIIFFSMVWNIAFSVVSGLKQMPADVKAVGRVFGLTGWQRFCQVLLPAIFPSVLTGSILSVADGWNIVIVAEALHAYAPLQTGAHDLVGIGSMLVTASTHSDTGTLVVAMTSLVAVIVLMNVALWQPLLAYAKRFSFE